MIVDDDFFGRIALKTVLEQYQLDVHLAVEGQSAIDQVKHLAKESGCSFDLILMDLQMQGVGGVQASQAIRKFMSEEACDLQQPYICCITVHNTLKDKIQACSVGIDAF